MNKEQLITILQAVLFNFEGATEEEIMQLNPSYDRKLVQVGIKFCEYLQSINLEATQ